MAKYSSKDLKIEFDNAAGTLVDMSNYIETCNGLSIEALIAASTAFGDSWEESFSTGILKAGDVTLGFKYDDTATTGPDAIFNDVGNKSMAAGATRTLKFTWGGTKTTSIETIIKKYDRKPSVGAFTMGEVALQTTGAATEV